MTRLKRFHDNTLGAILALALVGASVVYPRFDGHHAVAAVPLAAPALVVGVAGDHGDDAVDVGLRGSVASGRLGYDVALFHYDYKDYQVQVIANGLARTVNAPAEIPIGVVTSLLGAPFFLYLIQRRKRQLSV